MKDIKRAAEINDVKVKNLKRWIYVGHKRKEGYRYSFRFLTVVNRIVAIFYVKHLLNCLILGGGRKKEDPVMED